MTCDCAVTLIMAVTIAGFLWFAAFVMWRAISKP